MNRSHSSPQRPSKTDPHGVSEPRTHDERIDGHSEDYDARGGQFFGPPGDYGRQQGWQDGHLVGRERAMGAPDTGYDPDYHQWHQQQMRAFDDDYKAYRGERYKKFSEEFSAWRTARALTKGATSKPADDGQPEGGAVSGRK